MRRRMLLKSSTCGYFTDIVGLLAPACGEPEIVRTIAGKAEGIAVWQGEAEEGKGRGGKGIANEGVGAAAGKPDGAIRHGDDAVQIFGVAERQARSVRVHCRFRDRSCPACRTGVP